MVLEFKLNSNSTKSNSKIELKFNWSEMGYKLVEEILKICWRIWCRKKKNWKTRIQKDTFPCHFTWEWAKRIRVWNYSSLHGDSPATFYSEFELQGHPPTHSSFRTGWWVGGRSVKGTFSGLGKLTTFVKRHCEFMWSLHKRRNHVLVLDCELWDLNKSKKI